MKTLALNVGLKTGYADNTGKSGVWHIQAKGRTKGRLAEPTHIKFQNLWRKINLLGVPQTLILKTIPTNYNNNDLLTYHQLTAIALLWASLNKIDIKWIDVNKHLNYTYEGEKGGRNAKIIKKAQALGYEINRYYEGEAILMYDWWLKGKS